MTSAREEVRARRQQRERFAHAKRSELWYSSQLREVARVIGTFTDIYDPKDESTVTTLISALKRYADILNPWAHSVAARMLADTDRRNARAWRQHGKEMGVALREEIETAPTGETMRRLMSEQVTLIASLPLEAAQRVHELAIEGRMDSSRGQDIYKMIMETGSVTASRATLIARTETSRAAALLTEARANYVGSEAYIWRTVGDSDVRPRHQALDGKVIRWSDPPVAGENGERAHAGCIYNCRCWAEVILPDHLQVSPNKR